jgi:hypothetical protein
MIVTPAKAAVRQAIRQAHGPEKSRRTHHPERLRILSLVAGASRVKKIWKSTGFQVLPGMTKNIKNKGVTSSLFTIYFK